MKRYFFNYFFFVVSYVVIQMNVFFIFIFPIIFIGLYKKDMKNFYFLIFISAIFFLLIKFYSPYFTFFYLIFLYAILIKNNLTPYDIIFSSEKKNYSFKKSLYIAFIDLLGPIFVLVDYLLGRILKKKGRLSKNV